MENSRKSLLDNLEAKAFLEEGRQSSKKDKEPQPPPSQNATVENVAITVRIPRFIYEALSDASFYSKRNRIKEFDTQQAIVIDALTVWLKEKGYLG